MPQQRLYAPFRRITAIGVKPKRFQRVMVTPDQPFPALPLDRARRVYQDMLIAGSLGVPGQATDLRPVKN